VTGARLALVLFVPILSGSQVAWAEEVKPGPAAPTLDAAGLAAQVREEFLHAWNGYKKYAWGKDDLLPVSHAGRNWHADTLYMTPVDALDTLILMGLDEEATSTREFLARNLSFDRDIEVKNFEITIRMLGGLLSSYQLSGDRRLLALAEDLGDRLLPAFGSPTGMPYMYVNLKTGKVRGAESNPAEIGTLILEFGTLARLTNRPVFFDKAKRALVALYERRSAIDLVGQGIDVATGKWTDTESHVGGGIDSYDEYLLKCERLFGDPDCGAMWKTSIAAVNRYLADEGPGGGLWYGVSDMASGRRIASTYGALEAFLPAVLALGGDLDRARRLQDSGFRMWTLHGIEPEVLDYRTMKVVSPGYQLRPEIVESAYYLHQLTGDERYLEMGRTFLQDLVANCRTDAGYTVLKSVVTKEQGDYMPSYFLAETLKYLYLLFAPQALDFDSVVFNTEAHPLRATWRDGQPKPLPPSPRPPSPRPASVSAGVAAVEARAAPAPAPDAVYSTRDLFFPAGGLRLSARLYAPAAASRHPVVVMVRGSGNESVIGSYYTRTLAEAFARVGIAFFAYDKRGTGKSGGTHTGSDFSTLGGDAAAAMRFAGRLPGVQGVGFWGISQAGWIIPYALRERTGAVFAILVSPAGVNPFEQMTFFLHEKLLGIGLTEAEADEADAMHRATLLYYASGRGYRDAQATIDRYRGEAWFHRAVTSEYWDPMAGEGRLFTPAQLAEALAKRPGEFLLARSESSFMDYGSVYESLTVPVLVIYGSDDRLVPIGRSRAVIEAALRRIGSTSYEFKVFDGADHGIWTPDGDVRPDYLDLISRWARARFDGQAGPSR
jgi:alpha-beta hydrolase superfamily lysophospholipase